MKTKRVLKKILAISTGAIMMGATMTGALALDYSLSQYPEMFIKNGILENTVLVVGKDSASSDAIGQSVLLADLQTKAVTPTKSVIVGTDENNIKLGNTITEDDKFEQYMDQAEIVSLAKGSINFNTDDYDTKEILALKNELTVETSLTSNDMEYIDNVFLEVPRYSVNMYYAFNDPIAISNATNVNPIEITFMGKKITIIDAEHSKMTAYIGTEYFMDQGDSVTINGKTVKLVRVGSAGAVVVDVDGVQQTISANQVRTVNSIEIKNDDTFYNSDNTEVKNAANLVIGKNAVQTIEDGDAYIGEDKDSPRWVWKLDNLDVSDQTDITATTSGITQVGPIIGITNKFLANSFDNQLEEGCFELPNNYLSVCLEGPTDREYQEYTMEYDSSTDLSDVGYSAKEDTIHIYTDLNDGLKTTNRKTTSDLWLYQLNENDTKVFYKDGNSKVKEDALINSGDTFATINFANTRGNDLKLKLDFSSDNETLSIVPDSTLVDDDTLSTYWEVSGNKVVSLGDELDKNEAKEITWNSGIEIGLKDETTMTKYGIKIFDPENNGDSEQIILGIPNDQVYGVVKIGTKGTTSGNVTATTNSNSGVNPIPSSATALDTEITDPTAQNVIVIGGVAINKLAGMEGFPKLEEYKVNEAFVKLADNGANVALLVAGYSGIDSLNACEAIAAGKLKNTIGAEARVTSATQTRGSYVIE